MAFGITEPDAGSNSHRITTTARRDVTDWLLSGRKIYVSGVDRAVKQAIPVIDDFRPGTAYSPRSGRVEPNITVGRRLGENVRARLTSGLAEDPQLRSTIEWRLGRSFTVEPSYDRINTASSSNVGNFGVDFRWRLEFD